ncbi:hypothetical protein WKH46_06080 [Pantoea agglomerans]|uniref:hypothetical protein n=1 Tax=Enterobacter agglomerans TaxID=549 RepID=UPI003C7D6E21
MLSIQPVHVLDMGAQSNEGWLITSGDSTVKKTYNFEESISNDMSLPDQFDSIQVMNIAYARLVEVLEKHNPGLAADLLDSLDESYQENSGLSGQMAFAQLAHMVKAVTVDKK